MQGSSAQLRACVSWGMSTWLIVKLISVCIKFTCRWLWWCKSSEDKVLLEWHKAKGRLPFTCHSTLETNYSSNGKRIYLQWLQTCLDTGGHIASTLCWILYWHVTGSQICTSHLIRVYRLLCLWIKNQNNKAANRSSLFSEQLSWVIFRKCPIT